MTPRVVACPPCDVEPRRRITTPASALSGRYRRNTSAFFRTPDTTCWYIRLRLRVLPKHALLCSKTSTCFYCS